MTSPSLPLFVLVHGTWGNGLFPSLSSFLRSKRHKSEPRWFEENSPFRNALIQELEDAELAAEIVSFKWSGSNSIYARSLAADSLRELLLSRGCGRSVTVIAHSHGGNVALRAVDGNYSHPDTTVVTLATPFLRIIPRSDGLKFGDYWITTYLPCTALSLSLIFLIALKIGLSDVWLGPILLSSLLMGVPITWWFIDTFINPAPRNPRETIHRAWKNRPFKLAAAANYKIKPELKLFVLRGVNDEAGLTLAAGRIAATFSNVLWKRLVALVPLALPMIKFLGDWFDENKDFNTLFFLMAIVSALCFCLLYASNLFNSVFGRELLVGASRAEVGADSTPDAKHALVRTLSPLWNISSLRHYIYDHPDCASAIINFLKQVPQKDLSVEERIRLPLQKRSASAWFASKWIATIIVCSVIYLAANVLGFVPKIEIDRPDVVRFERHEYQLLGFDAPRRNSQSCEGEKAQVDRILTRLRQLATRRKVEFHKALCPCRAENDNCIYGRYQCGRLEIDGEDVATILIREGYAYPYNCEGSKCPRRRPWC